MAGRDKTSGTMKLRASEIAMASMASANAVDIRARSRSNARKETAAKIAAGTPIERLDARRTLLIQATVDVEPFGIMRL
jgi:hypothetical protein